MPYKSDTIAIKNSKLDRRVKLQPEQKEDVRKLHKQGIAIREITRRFGVSRRLIQFVIFPERYKLNVEHYHERGGWEAYYNKKRHADYMKIHRKYKNKLYKSGKIK